MLQPEMPPTFKRRFDYLQLREFIDHHDGCAEREASLVVALEEQEGDYW